MDPQAQQSQNPMNMAPAESKKVGPIIAILIIVLILIIGALYLFASRINQEQPNVDSSVAGSDSSQTTAAAQQSVQPVTNKSDDVNAIQADLNASTNGLDNQNF